MAWNPFFSRRRSTARFVPMQDINEPRQEAQQINKVVSSVVKIANHIQKQINEAVYNQAKLDSSVALGGIEAEIRAKMSEAVNAGDPDAVKEAYAQYDKLREEALKDQDNIYAKAFDEQSATVRARLNQKMITAYQGALAVNSDAEIEDTLALKINAAATDDDLAGIVGEYVEDVNNAILPRSEKEKRRVQGVLAILQTGAKKNPSKTAADLANGKYDAYIPRENAMKIARFADDERFYKALRLDPERLKNDMETFKSYDEKTRYDREKLIDSVLKLSKEKENKGIPKQTATAESAEQEIQAQYFADTYKQMEQDKKTGNLFDLMDYREAVGRAYSQKQITEKKFADLMKKTLKPLYDGITSDAFNRPLLYESAFEYGVKKLESAFGEQLNDPTAKAAVFDAYYQKIKDAGINPDERRTDKNKTILYGILNDVAADVADKATGMIVPERAGALVIGGRYYRRKFEEPTTEPSFVKGGTPAPLSKDEKGNVLKNENGIYRTVRVKPSDVRGVTANDVLRRIREAPVNPVPDLIVE